MFLKYRRDVLLKSFLVCLLMAASLDSLWAQTPARSPTIEQNIEDTPAAAFLALKERKYDLVVSITNRIAQKNPKSSSNWYLMAIASNLLGDYEMASNALTKAISIDPKLGFTSTPERVKILEKSISEGLIAIKEIDQSVAPAVAPAVQISPLQTAELKPIKSRTEIATQDVKAIDAKVEVKPEGIEEKPNVVENKVIDIEKNKDSKTIEINNKLVNSDKKEIIFILLIISVFIVFFVSLFLSFYAKKYYSKIQNSKLISAATMPLDKLIDFNRDNAEILLERLGMHGHKETALYQSTIKALVSLQIESGKSRIEAKKILDRIAVSDTVKVLDEKPMVLGKDESKNIHEMALKIAIKGKISK